MRTRHTHNRKSPAAAREVRGTNAGRLASPLHSLIAQSQPGFEPIVASELKARAIGVQELGRRTIPGKTGMLLFTAAKPQMLHGLRTAEDLLRTVGYGCGISPERIGLERVRTISRDAPGVDAALQARLILHPGSRTGRRLGFRVVARMVGRHEFRRVDFQRAVERGIAERGDHAWRLDGEKSAIEFWASLLDGEMILAIRLTGEELRHRDYKVTHRPASLRPAAAAALCWLSEPRDDDIVLDPMCGAATILIERAYLKRYAMLLGGDSNPGAIEAARANIGPRYKPIELRLWDASSLPLPDASVSKIVTNLPWGRRTGSHDRNRELYPRLLAEFRRVLRLNGIMVLLTSETGLMRALTERKLVHPRQILNVTILGMPAAIYVCR